MKIIIDIPKNKYEEVCGGLFDADGYFKANLTLAFRKGTPLPDNATNGDMIKVLFPNMEQDICGRIYIPEKMEWWNAKYKGGDTE